VPFIVVALSLGYGLTRAINLHLHVSGLLKATYKCGANSCATIPNFSSKL